MPTGWRSPHRRSIGWEVISAVMTSVTFTLVYLYLSHGQMTNALAGGGTMAFLSFLWILYRVIRRRTGRTDPEGVRPPVP
jgi:hypothetical protein